MTDDFAIASRHRTESHLFFWFWSSKLQGTVVKIFVKGWRFQKKSRRFEAACKPLFESRHQTAWLHHWQECNGINRETASVGILEGLRFAFRGRFDTDLMVLTAKPYAPRDTRSRLRNNERWNAIESHCTDLSYASNPRDYVSFLAPDLISDLAIACPREEKRTNEMELWK